MCTLGTPRLGLNSQPLTTGACPCGRERTSPAAALGSRWPRKISPSASRRWSISAYCCSRSSSCCVSPSSTEYPARSAADSIPWRMREKNGLAMSGTVTSSFPERSVRRLLAAALGV